MPTAERERLAACARVPTMPAELSNAEIRRLRKIERLTRDMLKGLDYMQLADHAKQWPGTAMAVYVGHAKLRDILALLNAGRAELTRREAGADDA